jgi:hypothetical protein
MQLRRGSSIFRTLGCLLVGDASVGWWRSEAGFENIEVVLC